MAANVTLLSSLSSESQLLLLTAAGPERDGEIRELLRGGLRWLMLLRLAHRERATAILWQRFAGLMGLELPPEVAGKLQLFASLAEFRQGYLEERLHDSLRVLAAARIPILLLKGAALATTVYGSFSRRPMADIDLLVHPERAQEAQRLLLAHGWRQSIFSTREQFYSGHQHLPPLDDARGTGLNLELHTDLFFRGHPFGPLAELMWAHAAAVPQQAPLVRAPHLVHQLLHLCLHYAWSHMLGSGTWRTFRDVAAIVETGRVEWDEFLRLARETQAVAACYWTLRLARNLVGVPVPPPVLQAMQPRLPERVLGTLERHFIHELFPTESLCPSVRVRQVAWNLAMQPRRSGHGSVRPWDRDMLFAAGDEARRAEDTGPNLWHHLKNLRRWSGYLGAVLHARPASSRPASS